MRDDFDTAYLATIVGAYSAITILKEHREKNPSCLMPLPAIVSYGSTLVELIKGGDKSVKDLKKAIPILLAQARDTDKECALCLKAWHEGKPYVPPDCDHDVESLLNKVAYLVAFTAPPTTELTDADVPSKMSMYEMAVSTVGLGIFGLYDVEHKKMFYSVLARLIAKNRSSIPEDIRKAVLDYCIDNQVASYQL